MPNNALKKYTTMLNVKVQPDLKERLSDEAWRSRKTLSAYIRSILENRIRTQARTRTNA